MPSAREDYLIRMIQQMGEVLARLRRRLTGQVDASEAADIGQQASAAIVTLLGPQSSLLQQLDAPSAVRLVGDPERVELWVGLLRVQADARRADTGRGDHEETADRLAARASALEQAAKQTART
jgi:hypothetical protein